MMEGDKILHMEIIVPKIVVAPLSVTLTRSTFSIDIVVHLFIKLEFVIIEKKFGGDYHQLVSTLPYFLQVL